MSITRFLVARHPYKVSDKDRRPLRLRKTAYWQRPELVGRFNANPFYRKTPGPAVHAPAVGGGVDG